MLCSKCSYENPKDAKYCGECGNKLQLDNSNHSKPPIKNVAVIITLTAILMFSFLYQAFWRYEYVVTYHTSNLGLSDFNISLYSRIVRVDKLRNTYQQVKKEKKADNK